VEYELMMKERERLESAVQEKRQQANRLDNKKKGEKSKNSTESAGRLGHAKMTGTKQRKLYQAAKSMEKRLAALEDIQAPEHLRSIR
ncbi:Msr family ABC-F type ribosomal protection protein, partial [Escherichia coli]|nr:Msr family ABC-F type ribosomal protection protein [Escherichia coli]